VNGRHGSEHEQKHYVIASSLRVVLEQTVLELGRWLDEESDEGNLCLAGVSTWQSSIEGALPGWSCHVVQTISVRTVESYFLSQHKAPRYKNVGEKK
jgi:hypothetical protein